MAASLERGLSRWLLIGPVAIAALVLCLVFPWFHVVPLAPPEVGRAGGFDPAAAAAKIWQFDLPAAAARAVDVVRLVEALRKSPAEARARFSHSAPLGTAYFFVRGRGQVVARERLSLRLALDDAQHTQIEIPTGPVFGNAVRDGCGLLDVNAFPGVQEFNALSAELNALVEKNLLPVLSARARIGAAVVFTGCVEAPENLPEANEPILSIVPVEVRIR